jgi:hypothetical protein
LPSCCASVGVLAPAGSGQTTTRDAVTAARFALTTDGYELASFSELQRITSEVTPTEYMSSTDPSPRWPNRCRAPSCRS